MDRRTFVLLTGATSGALIRPPVRPTHSPTGAGWRSGGPAVGRLRFELDDHRRWSLWYYGDGSPVPVVRGAEIVAWVGDQPLTLAELEDSTVGNRRPPGGDAVVVRGRAAGVWVEAELLTAGGASTPQASLTVTVFPDRYLPTVRGVRFFQLPHADVLAGDGPLTALVNGAHSADPTRVVTVGAPEAEGLASHAAVGLTRGSRGLAIAFDAGEPGEARVQLSRDALEAVSDWLPARPLRPEGDASHMRLCFHPEGDGLEALRALFVPSSPVDQERLAQAVAPAGWCTRAEWSGTVAEADVITNLDFSAAHFDRRFFRHIELDDGSHPKVQQWLFDLARRVVREWGYDYLRVDRLRWATLGTAHYGGLTHAEAYRAGLGAIRDGLGTEAFLLASEAPLQHAVGLVNGMRIGPDVDVSWSGIQSPARAAGLRSFYHRSTWLNDPDCLVVRAPLSRAAAEVWASVVAVTGGLTLLGDNLPNLPPDRLPLLQRTLPVAPVTGRPIEAGAAERDTAPAIVAGHDVYPISGPWRFRTGDDPSYGSRGFDEEAWETIPVPQRWDEAGGGHPQYAGFAWYRTRLRLPNLGAGKTQPRNVYVELGKIADADETFVNGVKVGQTGELSSGGRGEAQAYRRYRVPPETLNWGGENVLAVRVLGSGGIWSVRRTRPPRVWVAEGAPRWWTVVVVNWEDEPLDLSLPLAALGVKGARFDAYDVWRDAAVTDLKDGLTVTVEPRSARTIAIRPAGARPQVIGTTRHLVQGAVDVADETWDPTTRTLKAKSTNLDGRAYAVTIAVPKGLRPGACKADVPCMVRRLQSGHAVLEWPAGGDGRDIGWELSFKATPATRKDKD